MTDEWDQICGGTQDEADRAATTDPIDTDLFWFSEWLDSQGLIRSEDETGDQRSHEQLVRDFLARPTRPRGAEESP
jgi:5'-deoxynucleotidase YfbR-like HD superfamily hydrolase